MSITTPDKQGGAPAPAPEPNVPITQPDAFVPPTPQPKSKKPRGLVATIALLVLGLAGLIGAKILFQNGGDAVIANTTGQKPDTVASQPATSTAPSAATAQTPSLDTIDSLATEPRPDPNNPRATAQWFEDQTLAGMLKNDPRYFYMVTGNAQSQAYLDSLAAMRTNMANGTKTQSAAITDFKVIDSGIGYFIATYRVQYTGLYNGVSVKNANAQIEKIQVTSILGKWYLDTVEYTAAS